MKKVKLKIFKVLTNSQKHIAAAFPPRVIDWNFQRFCGRNIKDNHIFILKHFCWFWELW